jgi:hypothetical protein
MTEQPGQYWIWTAMLSENRYAYLQLPDRLITEDDWNKLMYTLELLKPGLIKTEKTPEQTQEEIDNRFFDEEYR